MEKLIYLYWKDINLLSLSYENQQDSVFDKLYKIAQKSEKTTHDGFWISVN